MRNPAFLDMVRAFGHAKRRFLAIAIIVMLGICMLTGIHATCQDIYNSADLFYKQQKLFDIEILSTLGFTQEDIDILAGLDGVASAQGVFTEEVYTDIDGTQYTAEMTVFTPDGLNVPYVMQGRLPQNANEIAVTDVYIETSEKTVGDTVAIVQKESEEDAEEDAAEEEDGEFSVEIEEDEEETFLVKEFTITGVVLDPKNIANKDYGDFRTSVGSDFTFFILPSAVSSDVYTAAYLTLEGMDGVQAFSDAYEEVAESYVKRIESTIKKQREQARYEEVYAEAKGKIDDVRDEIYQKFDEAEQELADAQKDIEDGEQELIDGQEELEENRAKAEDEFAKARDEIARGRQQLEEGRAQAETEFAAAEQTLLEKQQEAKAGLEQAQEAAAQLSSALGDAWPSAEYDALRAAAETEIANGTPQEELPAKLGAQSAALYGAAKAASDTMIGALNEEIAKTRAMLEQLEQDPNAPEEQKAALRAAIGQMEQSAGMLAAVPDGAVSAAMGEGAAMGGLIAVDDGYAQLEQQKQAFTDQMAAAQDELDAGERTLNQKEADAYAELEEAEQEIEDGRAELEDGKEELQEHTDEYLENRQKAEDKLAEGYAELDDIDVTKWYVRTRSALDSYSGMKSDMTSISKVGIVFPIIFLLVAILISLTSMQRMVEEDRGLIGTYKELGYSRLAISRKYLLFALFACIIGGVLGDIAGFVVFPKILFEVLKALYVIPDFHLAMDALYGVGGVCLFAGAVVAATAYTCRAELIETPASLMRPKAPKAGSRVFLERIPSVWNRLKFLNKVTVRNLFRYKKRFFMTIIGIAGCTALLLCGFSIKDSVDELVPKQFSGIYRFDLLVTAADDEYETLLSEIEADGCIESKIDVFYTAATIYGEGGKPQDVHMMVLPDGEDIDAYLHLTDERGNGLVPDADGVVLTKAEALQLQLGAGDQVEIEDIDLNIRDANVKGIARNLVGDTLYISSGLYEELFGEYEPNTMLAELNDTIPDPIGYVDDLSGKEGVQAVLGAQKQIEEFEFDMINAVVALIVFMAGGLAFVVLYTLSSTNISERIRELAAIKVLGFFDKEVHQYVNKETMILTAIGIALGIPLGIAFAGMLTSTLNMPGLYFEVEIKPLSYLYTIVIAFGFSLIVMALSDRTLNKINMIEALKSVE